MNPIQFIPIISNHRSGSSCVAGALRRVGLWMGEDDEMIRPTIHNPRGYNELVATMDFNDHLLNIIGCTWFDPPPANTDYEHWFDRANKYQGIGRMLVVLRYLENSAIYRTFPGCGAFSMKDPRQCFTLPLWLRLLPLGMPVKLIIVKREIDSVVRSLNKWYNMPEDYALELCDVYQKAIDRLAEKHSHLIVKYESFISQTQTELQVISDFIGVSSLSWNNLTILSALEYVDKSLNRCGRRPE